MAAIFDRTAYGYYGYSGWTLLDENGDRRSMDHDIWGFRPDPGEPSIINYGRFDVLAPVVEALSWDYVLRPWDRWDCVP